MTTQSRLLPSNPAQFHAITTGIMIYLLAFTAITVMGFPLLWMILCSFKEPAELYQAPPNFLPATITFRNYTDLFTQTGFARYFVNSLIVASATTFLALTLGALGGYTLNRFRFLAWRRWRAYPCFATCCPKRSSSSRSTCWRRLLDCRIRS